MAINKIPKQVRCISCLVRCLEVLVIQDSFGCSLSWPLFHTQPPPPLDPAQTKRSDSEPLVEKARFSSLARDERAGSAVGSTRTPLEPRVLIKNQNLPEGQGSGSEARASSSRTPNRALVSAPVLPTAQPDVKNENNIAHR